MAGVDWEGSWEGGGGGAFARSAWSAKREGKKKERFTVGPCMYDNTFFIFYTGSFHLSQVSCADCIAFPVPTPPSPLNFV